MALLALDEEARRNYPLGAQVRMGRMSKPMEVTGYIRTRYWPAGITRTEPILVLYNSDRDETWDCPVSLAQLVESEKPTLLAV
ncbi:MAG: hypothetical protein NTY66_00955 [Candidatus Vogelbacteria bacterium]|nr:hypothetical protein [Candidatus Vogelbacteria bacterium]